MKKHLECCNFKYQLNFLFCFAIAVFSTNYAKNENNQQLHWGVKPLLQRNPCRILVSWLSAPPLTPGDQVRLGKVQRISSYPLSYECKNTFYMARKVTSSPPRKTTHAAIVVNTVHCRIASKSIYLRRLMLGSHPQQFIDTLPQV